MRNLNHIFRNGSPSHVSADARPGKPCARTEDRALEDGALEDGGGPML